MGATGWLLGLAVVAVLVAAGVVFVVRAQPKPIEPPPRGWKGDKITPAGLGPRSKAPERVARSVVLVEAVLLAVEMARADGDIDPTESDAIRDFIRNHVPEADEALATRVLDEGLGRKATPAKVTAAIETLRAVASEEQRELVLELFVHVARADGRLDEGEIAFMEQIGGELGLQAQAVKGLIAKAS